MSKREYAYWDSEFTRVSHPSLRLVSAAIEYDNCVEAFWMEREKDKKDLINYFLDLRSKDVVLVAFNVESEARFMIDLGLDPSQFTWIDLYLEFLMIRNHNHKYLYGSSLVDGKVKNLRPYVDEKSKPNLSNFIYKFTGKIIDSERKDRIRDLIISDPEAFTKEQEVEIMEYNQDDVYYLRDAHKGFVDELSKILPLSERSKYFEEATKRARYAIHTAYMVKRGYPINVEWAKNFSESIYELMDEAISDINSQFPQIQPFRFERKNSKWAMNTKNIRAWIADQRFESWELTDGGTTGRKQLSLSLEAWTKYFDYTHTYPRGNFGAQMVRFLKLKQSLNGFVNKGGSENKTFWDYVGPDGRVRPYFNIYGAQSSRSQPASTGYVMLKPAWQRALVAPSKGKVIIGCDYSSQEFLGKGLEARDKAMIKAYASGDVYLAFAKDAGIIPKDGTKAQYKYERDLCKSTILGLSYLMTKVGLAVKLTNDTGRYWSEDEAQSQVTLFEEVYPEGTEWSKEIILVYRDNGWLKLKDGWYMWGDNRNDRSAANMPIQGAGADVMRRAVELCYKNKLDVIMTLHDALYIEVDFDGWEDKAQLFDKLMKEAFYEYYKDTPVYEDAKLIRTELYAWGPDFEKEDTINGIAVAPVYVDDRAVDEYNRFNKYFINKPGISVL